MTRLRLNPQINFKMNENLIQRQLAPGERQTDLYDISNQVFLKYCHVEDVNKKRQIFCNFKAGFLAKLKQLKKQG